MIMVSIGNAPEKRKSCKKALVWEEKTAGQKNISQYTMSPKTGLTDSMFWYGIASEVTHLVAKVSNYNMDTISLLI